VPEAAITVVPAPDDGCQHPKHAELPVAFCWTVIQFDFLTAHFDLSTPQEFLSN